MKEICNLEKISFSRGKPSSRANMEEALDEVYNSTL